MMKMMEILKLWVRCINAEARAKQKPIATRTLVILARAAQEYYTSGLYTADIVDEIRNANTHPHLYDGKRHWDAGLAKIVNKYNIQEPYTNIPQRLAGGLRYDINNYDIPHDGRVPYAGVKWQNSSVLKTAVYTDAGYIYPNLVLALGKMLAARQK